MTLVWQGIPPDQVPIAVDRSCRDERLQRFPKLAGIGVILRRTSDRSGQQICEPATRTPPSRSTQIGANFGNAAKAAFLIGFYFAGMASRNFLASLDMRCGLTRRDTLAAAFIAGLPLALLDVAARAGQIDPADTAITPFDVIKWSAWSGGPPNSAEMAKLYGGLDTPGPYLVLMKWNPGYMSAPHAYATDRLSLVLSGTWWVNSGADFDPANAVPVSAGGFVRRLARTPHYDGVKRGAKEPAVIALFGIAPVKFELSDPGKPAWRHI